MRKIPKEVQRGWTVLVTLWAMTCLVLLSIGVYYAFDWETGYVYEKTRENYMYSGGISALFLLATQIPRIISYVWLGQFKMYPKYIDIE